MKVWKVYYPDDGETAADAVVVEPRENARRFFDAEDAAQRACEIDYDERDGWERGNSNSFPIVVISPDGTETRWTGRHEPSVNHTVLEDQDE